MTKNGRLGSRPEDFEAQGIVQGAPTVWEDGRRMDDLSLGEYEWWYSDGHFSNGMMVVFGFNFIVDQQGNMLPQIALNIANQEGIIVDQIVNYQASDVTTKKESCDVVIGSNYFRSVDGLDAYEIFVDPATNNGFGANVQLERIAPSYRPGSGFWANEDNEFFAWLCAVPGGTMTGTLTFDGNTVEVEGSGYHDHNWGNVPMDALLGDWLWGRAEVEGMTVVMASVRFNENNGSVETPLLYVTKGSEVIVDAFNEDLVCLEGVKVTHPDTQKKISSDCIFILNEDIGQASVRFAGQQVIATLQMPSSSEEWETWYLRFASMTSLNIEMNGYDIYTKAPSVLESMDFLGKRK